MIFPYAHAVAIVYDLLCLFMSRTLMFVHEILCVISSLWWHARVSGCAKIPWFSRPFARGGYGAVSRLCSSPTVFSF
jgi:hypothetical protein